MKVPDPKKLKSGNWFIQLRLGGVSVPVTASTAKECRRQAQLIKAEHLAGRRDILPASGMTLSNAIDAYINKRSNTLSPLTIRGYRIIQKNRFKDDMFRPLSSIHRQEWQIIVNNEAALCAPKTLKNAWGFVRSVVKDATGEYPPDITLPTELPPDKPFLTPAQIPVFVRAVKDTKYAVPALLALSSLRASEIEALRWENIPTNAQFIKVSGAVVLDEHNHRVYKKQNKNKTSVRNVPIMIPELAAALERDRQPRGPVMAFRQNSLRYGIEKICRENDLPNVGIHGLRHSFASLAYHLQIPEKIAMEVGGWADSATMHSIYTHIAQSDITRYQTRMTTFFKQHSAENANENANAPQKT